MKTAILIGLLVISSAVNSVPVDTEVQVSTEEVLEEVFLMEGTPRINGGMLYVCWYYKVF